MYFTESEDTLEDPIELNTGFAARHDSAEFEKKIATLMNRAYDRLRSENPPTAGRWNEAISSVGDGYRVVGHYHTLWIVGPSWNDFVPLIRRTGDRNCYPSSASAASSGSSASGILQIFVRYKKPELKREHIQHPIRGNRHALMPIQRKRNRIRANAAASLKLPKRRTTRGIQRKKVSFI